LQHILETLEALITAAHVTDTTLTLSTHNRDTVLMDTRNMSRPGVVALNCLKCSEITTTTKLLLQLLNKY